MQIALKQYWTLLIKYLRPQWKRSSLLSFFLLGNIALQLVNPQIIRNFLDAAQIGVPGNRLLRLSLLFLGLAFLQQITSVFAGYFSEIVAWTSTNALRVDLVDHCIRLDLSFHNTHTPGEIIERVDGDVNNLANFFSRFVVELLGNVLLMIGVLVLLWWENWAVGFGLTVFVSLSMFIMLRYRNVAVPYWAAERQASAEFFGFLEERLAGTEDIRANGAESYVMHNFHALIREMLRKSLKSAMVINVLININHFLFALGTAVAFAIGTYLFQGEIVTIGTLYLIYQYTTMLGRPMENITHQVDQFQRAGAGIIRIQELFNIKSKIQEAYTVSQDATTLKGLPPPEDLEKQPRLGLQFDLVTFGYDDLISANHKIKTWDRDKDLVLTDISFSLDPGKVLGLLGRTGSGKTTLTRLIFRFYDPDRGSVLIGPVNGFGMVDVRQMPLKELRRQVGVVTQNIQLFNASVRDNLTFFDDSIPDVLIEKVIKELGLLEWYQSLPDGLNTILESGGAGLSAGEAQLLAFTRVFLGDPGLVVLDEASSRLDPATETLIEHAVERLVQGRTAIIIAHHLKTVQKTDQILILEDGFMKEYGERISLMNDPSSRFSKLLQMGLEEVLV